MKKILIIPKNIETISRTNKYSDGYIIGIENLCTNIGFCVNKDTIDILRNLYGKDDNGKHENYSKEMRWL